MWVGNIWTKKSVYRLKPGVDVYGISSELSKEEQGIKFMDHIKAF